MNRRFAGTRIPTFDEALMAIGPSAMPVIELKVPIPPELLLRALRKYDLESEVMVLSFDEAWLHPIRRASRDVAIGLLAETWRGDLPERARRLAADVLCLNVDILGTTEVAMTEAQGLDVWCYTANDAGMVAACAAMGVTGIITDRPDLIRAR
jgi:glycerophosphoryl diester phosphodiesterase